ncbi:hypothetical protein ISN44_As07g009230 [Arabidopsis suecica]|uniref:Uncharacterized protein n=1 Tax=Arabidopsis suecica TaxID=45249 RepID=A0A8T2BNZ4_ARASU|nr:hypothetical protein ISN44_As07g009230 [Arabidopsis suecica]
MQSPPFPPESGNTQPPLSQSTINVMTPPTSPPPPLPLPPPPTPSPPPPPISKPPPPPRAQASLLHNSREPPRNQPPRRLRPPSPPPPPSRVFKQSEKSGLNTGKQWPFLLSTEDFWLIELLRISALVLG